jgi:uroporphyrinogen decarboxylase
MTSKERIRAILSDESADRVGFWLGNPADETKEIYYKHFRIQDASSTSHQEEQRGQILTTKTGHADLELALALNSDMMWISPELDLATWKHPEGKPMWDILGGKPRESLSQPGVFAECEDIKDVEAFDWPNPDYLDFTTSLVNIDEARAEGLAVFGGMWCPFFHLAADFFGMENYFVKMHTHPAVVEAVTEHIVDFYLEANKRCLDLMASSLDAAFFGNDFGSQRDLLISPRAFKRFVLPYFKKIIDQMKSYGLKVVLHSCGSIVKVIPLLIEAGTDALHPLQARAAGMDAENLARQFKGDLVFIGGVDTQELLPFGNPENVRQEVRRLKQVFGERFIVSPSHEALLPNVSIENVIAMSEEARTQ